MKPKHAVNMTVRMTSILTMPCPIMEQGSISERIESLRVNWTSVNYRIDVNGSVEGYLKAQLGLVRIQRGELIRQRGHIEHRMRFYGPVPLDPTPELEEHIQAEQRSLQHQSQSETPAKRSRPDDGDLRDRQPDQETTMAEMSRSPADTLSQPSSENQPDILTQNGDANGKSDLRPISMDSDSGNGQPVHCKHERQSLPACARPPHRRRRVLWARSTQP